MIWQKEEDVSDDPLLKEFGRTMAPELQKAIWDEDLEWLKKTFRKWKRVSQVCDDPVTLKKILGLKKYTRKAMPIMGERPTRTLEKVSRGSRSCSKAPCRCRVCNEDGYKTLSRENLSTRGVVGTPG